VAVGAAGVQELTMDREGMIHPAQDAPEQKIKRTSDPWGD
jgi:hypothetical protein